MVHGAPTARRPGRRRSGRIFARLFAPLVLLGVAAAVFLIVSSPPRFLQNIGAAPHRSQPAAHRRLPPYWRVRPGDTFAEIAAKTIGSWGDV